MTFTLAQLLDSIGGVLKENYPDISVYSNPNQQGTDVPCFFIFFMPTETENQMGRRYMRNIGIDVVYLVERNDPDAHDQLVSVADQLDFALEFIPYDGGELRTYEREWKIDDEELHYQFKVKAIVSHPDNTPSIESVESYKGGIKQDDK
ncbi:phage tail terminator family protein [Lacrimispora sp.]|uniref:phage tail terminator family protein n=1 Tax=Lacrimispora sp. TaxID=2719234 RepID=UPI002FDB626F